MSIKLQFYIRTNIRFQTISVKQFVNELKVGIQTDIINKKLRVRRKMLYIKIYFIVIPL